MGPDTFAALQDASSGTEFLTRSLAALRRQLSDRRPDEIAASVDNIVWVWVNLGELLPIQWGVTFDNLFRPGRPSWTTAREFGAVRQQVQRLFFTMREALETTRQIGESFQAETGRRPAGMDRLLAAMENAASWKKRCSAPGRPSKRCLRVPLQRRCPWTSLWRRYSALRSTRRGREWTSTANSLDYARRM